MDWHPYFAPKVVQDWPEGTEDHFRAWLNDLRNNRNVFGIEASNCFHQDIIEYRISFESHADIRIPEHLKHGIQVRRRENRTYDYGERFATIDGKMLVAPRALSYKSEITLVWTKPLGRKSYDDPMRDDFRGSLGKIRRGLEHGY